MANHPRVSEIIKAQGLDPSLVGIVREMEDTIAHQKQLIEIWKPKVRAFESFAAAVDIATGNVPAGDA